MGNDTKVNTWGRFECQLAYSSTCSAELPLRPSAIAAPPSGPRRLYRRLRVQRSVCLVVRRVNGR